MKKYSLHITLISIFFLQTPLEASKRVLEADDVQLTAGTNKVKKKRRKRDYDPEIIHEQLGLLVKGYYEQKLEDAVDEDSWVKLLKHPEAQKRLKKRGWPFVNREEFNKLFTDTKAQIANYKLTRDILLRETARAILEDEEDYFLDEERLDLDVQAMDRDELDDFRETATIIQGLQFVGVVKSLETQRNFKNYLKKHKPPELTPETSLDDFLSHAKEQGFELPKGYRKKGRKYLREYYFGE